MIVRSVYILRSFGTLDEALTYSRKINGGAGKHADSQLEIEYDKKAKKLSPLKTPDPMTVLTAPEPEDQEGLQWKVVVVNEDPVPGGSECAECSATHFEDDYLCQNCRQSI